MKGLLLKDWYAFKSYCRATLFIVILFAIIGGIVEENFFFVFYPCIFAGISTMNLLAYEERDKWEQYAATLPYTKGQMVSSKYIVSLCLGGAIVLINGIIQLICMIFLNTYDIDKLLPLLFALIPLTLLPAAFLLPFVFRFGVNKGRIAYYIVIVIFCGAIGALLSNEVIDLSDKVSLLLPYVNVIVFVATVIIYALSWGLSIHFYKNREI
ncbi:MAG: ABC-2 transporter permease [Butyribacter sp.]|nr:ABC-2 transporter permease [bacterium]MDY3855096.1 ABC-2 transporter permease [Butyribacter sp.]